MPRPAASSLDRRGFRQNSGLLLATATLARSSLLRAADPAAAHRVTLPFANGERDLVAFPHKRPLIVLTSRLPQLETPFSVGARAESYRRNPADGAALESRRLRPRRRRPSVPAPPPVPAQTPSAPK